MASKAAEENRGIHDQNLPIRTRIELVGCHPLFGKVKRLKTIVDRSSVGFWKVTCCAPDHGWSSKNPATRDNHVTAHSTCGAITPVDRYTAATPSKVALRSCSRETIRAVMLRSAGVRQPSRKRNEYSWICVRARGEETKAPTALLDHRCYMVDTGKKAGA